MLYRVLYKKGKILFVPIKLLLLLCRSPACNSEYVAIKNNYIKCMINQVKVYLVTFKRYTAVEGIFYYVT